VHTKKHKKPLNRGNTVPEVGLELHSLPRKHRAPPETGGCGEFKRFTAQVQITNDRVVEPFAAGTVVLHIVPGPPCAELLASG
jgi:hypothetical protein